MRFPKPFLRLSVIVPILSIMAGVPARAQEPNESYYMTIFSAQAESRDPRLTHSFATFVKATGTGDSAKDYRTESHTISWMPQALNIVVLRLRPEPGTNLDLASSLRWAESRNCRESMWGPYQIDKELYDRAIKQEARLKSGRVLYKAIDRKFRPGIASNCGNRRNRDVRHLNGPDFCAPNASDRTATESEGTPLFIFPRCWGR